MVSLALGLMVTGAAISVTLSSGRNFRNEDAAARLQENARYALQTLAADIALADFWGEFLDPEAISLGAVQIPPRDDCGLTDDWAITPQPALESQVRRSAAAISTRYPCIRASKVRTGTDILVVKHVTGEREDSRRADRDDNGHVYLRTNNEAATVVRYDHAESPDPTDPTRPGPNVHDWQFVTHVYYVRNESVVGSNDGIPTLYRKRLYKLDMREDPGGVAPGIEYFHVMWGIDQDGDGTPDTYQAAPDAKALTARVYVLVRTIAEDFTYWNRKVYQMGTDASGDPIRFDLSASPDHYRRRVFVTTVQLRNRAQLRS